MRVPAPPQYAPPEWSSQQNVTSNSTSRIRSSRQAELEALRRKGLAKIFNKHFTSVTDSIRHEQEAAELALRDLERRKEEYKLQHPNFASNKSYQDEMSQLERMHMELQRRKQTALRKERETMELYRRYVSQYGSNSEQALQIASQMKRSSLSKPSNMPVLHEYGEAVDDDIVRQADLLMSKAMERSDRESQIKGDSHVGDMTKNLENPPMPSSDIPTSRNVGKLSHTSYPMSSTGGEPPLVPDAKSTTTKISPSITAPRTSVVPTELDNDVSIVTSPPDLQSSTQTEEECSETAGSNNTNKGASSLASTSRRSGATPKTEGDDNSGNTDSYNPPQTSIDLLSRIESACSDDNLSDSDMSGLTMDGATIAEAEFKLLEFLKIETDNIRKMMNGDEAEDSSVSTLNNDTSTVRSLDSKRAQEAARVAEDMAKQMEEASAWMKDPSLLLQNDKANEQSDNSSKKNKNKKEWCAYWSSEHQREYYFNLKTNQTTWTKPSSVDIDRSTLEKNSSANSQKEDDSSRVVVKDYTKRSIRNNDTAVLDNMSAIEQFRPERRVAFDDASVRSGRSGRSGMSGRSGRSGISGKSGGSGRSSRSLQYKRKQARRRRKRRIRVAAALIVAVSGLYYTREKWIPLLEKHTGMEISFLSSVNNSINNNVPVDKLGDQKKKTKVVKRKKSADLEQKRREEEAAAAEAAELKRKEEERKRKEAEIAAAKKAEEAMRRKEAEIAAAKKAEEERKRKEAEIAAAKKAEEERKRKEAAIAAAKKVEEERKRKEAEIAAAKKVEEERRKKLEEARKRRAAELAAAKQAEEEKKRKLEEERKRREAEIVARKAEEERRKKLEEERKLREAQLAAQKAEEERLRKIEEERKRKEEELARIEALRKAEEERQRKEEEERLLREKIRLEIIREQEEARKRQEEEEERQRLEAERIKAEEEASRAVAALETDKSSSDLTILDKDMKRPTACFFPLSYIVSKKCNFLASERPVFDVKDLTDSMMQ